ncbi:MAG TPA: hypothetical protein PKI78_12390, partial [Anaerolineales bacterium]|nr:hypothetical protein [Anaerolineales bacterium]
MTNPSIIKLNTKKVLIILFALVAFLVGMSIWGQHMRFFGVGDIRGPWHEFLIEIMMNAFYLDAESNIPTFINALMLFV